jgi:hypothetical protein
MRAARPLAPCLHYPLAPAAAGVFFMAAVGPAWCLYFSGDLEPRIRENTDDDRRVQAYYRQLLGRRLASLSSCHRLPIPAALMRQSVHPHSIPWDGRRWRQACWLPQSPFSPPTAMSISSDSSSSRSISKSEFLSSLPPWRRFLAKLNWHPTIDAQIKELESERRENYFKMREQESERRTKLIENDIERLEKENKRLANIESRLDALLLSADSSSPIPPATDSN